MALPPGTPPEDGAARRNPGAAGYNMLVVSSTLSLRPGACKNVMQRAGQSGSYQWRAENARTAARLRGSTKARQRASTATPQRSCQQGSTEARHLRASSACDGTSTLLRACHCRRDPVIDNLCPSPMSCLCLCCMFFCLLVLRSSNVYTLTIGCVLHSAQACSRRPLSSSTEQSIGRGDGAGGGGGEREWSPQAFNA